MFFTTFDDVRSGLRWSSARTIAASENRRLYDNEFDDLLVGYALPASVDRGKLVWLNWFRTTTDFYEAGVGAEGLVSSRDLVEMSRVVRELVISSSSQGYGVLMGRSDGTVESVDPRSWAPVLHPQDANRVVGAVLSFPFYDPGADAEVGDSAIRRWSQIDVRTPVGQEGLLTEANMVKVVLVDMRGTPRSEARVFEYSGGIFGRELASEMSDVTGVAYFGNGVNDYDAIKTAVRELVIRITADGGILNRHANPNLQGPRSAMTAMHLPGQDQPRYVFQHPEEGGFYPVDPDGTEYSYLQWDGNIGASHEHIAHLLSFIHQATGLPYPAGGAEGSGGLLGESGASREKALLRATSRIQQLRLLIVDALKQLDSGIVVEWDLEPFQTRAERRQSIREDFQAGVATLEEARERLGYS